MMGRHHALSGALVWFGVVGVGLGEVSHPGEAIAAAAACGAAAMLPDIDEPGSTVAHSLGYISDGVSKITNEVCGGHRKASHSLIGVAVVTGLAWLSTINPISAAAVFAFLILLAFRGLAPVGFRHGLIAFAVAVGSGVGVALGRIDVMFLPVAVGVGYSIHLVGDMLTTGGVPLLWPWKKHFSFPILGHTDSGREKIFAVAMLLALGGLVYISGIWHGIPNVSHIEHSVTNFTHHVSGQIKKGRL